MESFLRFLQPPLTNVPETVARLRAHGGFDSVAGLLDGLSDEYDVLVTDADGNERPREVHPERWLLKTCGVGRLEAPGLARMLCFIDTTPLLSMAYRQLQEEVAATTEAGGGCNNSTTAAAKLVSLFQKVRFAPMYQNHVVDGNLFEAMLLEAAGSVDDPHVLSLLIDAGADARDARTLSGGFTALMLSVVKPLVANVRFLVEFLDTSGLDLVSSDVSGSKKSALTLAAALGHTEICRILLSGGAAISSVSIHAARDASKFACMEMLKIAAVKKRKRRVVTKRGRLVSGGVDPQDVLPFQCVFFATVRVSSAFARCVNTVQLQLHVTEPTGGDFRLEITSFHEGLHPRFDLSAGGRQGPVTKRKRTSGISGRFAWRLVSTHGCDTWKGSMRFLNAGPGREDEDEDEDEDEEGECESFTASLSLIGGRREELLLEEDFAPTLAGMAQEDRVLFDCLNALTDDERAALRALGLKADSGTDLRCVDVLRMCALPP